MQCAYFIDDWLYDTVEYFASNLWFYCSICIQYFESNLLMIIRCCIRLAWSFYV